VKINDLIADIRGNAKMAQQSGKKAPKGEDSRKTADFTSVLKDEVQIKTYRAGGGEANSAETARNISADLASGRLDSRTMDALAERLAEKADWLPKKGVFPEGAGEAEKVAASGEMPELTPKEKVKGLLRLWKDLQQGSTASGGVDPEGEKSGPASRTKGPVEITEDLSSPTHGDPYGAAAASVISSGRGGAEGGFSTAGKQQGEKGSKMTGTAGDQAQSGPEGHGKGFRSGQAPDGAYTAEVEGTEMAKTAFARAEIRRRFEALMREHSIGPKGEGTPGEQKTGAPMSRPETGALTRRRGTPASNPGNTVESTKNMKAPEARAGRPGSGVTPGLQESANLQGGSKASLQPEAFSGKDFDAKVENSQVRDAIRSDKSPSMPGETAAAAGPGAPGNMTGQAADVDRAAALSQGMARVIEVIKERDGHRGRMMLEPPELGSVKIELQSSRDQVQLHLVVESAQAREMIDQSLDMLRQSLARQGLTLAETTVDVGGGGSSDQTAWETGQAQRTGGEPGTEGDEPQVPEEVVARLDIEKGLLNWIA
jgi:flagellar hook-length control protein FliK